MPRRSQIFRGSLRMPPINTPPKPSDSAVIMAFWANSAVSTVATRNCSANPLAISLACMLHAVSRRVRSAQKTRNTGACSTQTWGPLNSAISCRTALSITRITVYACTWLEVAAHWAVSIIILTSSSSTGLFWNFLMLRWDVNSSIMGFN